MGSAIRYLVNDAESGDTLFRTREGAEDWTALLDRDNVDHGPIEEIELGYDPDEVREIGGG